MPNDPISRRTFLQTLSALGVAGAGTCSSHLAAAPSESTKVLPIKIGSRRELFIDEHLIDSLTGHARQRLHHPIPREIVLVEDEPWEGTGSGYHTIIQDGELYRMYYRGWHLRIVNGKLNTGAHKPFTCYAESKDGLKWTKPKLGIVEFQGSSENNIIVQGIGTHNFAPFLDENPDCSPDARFKALAGIKSEGGLFAFKSADGIHWSLMSDKPVITNGAFDSQNIAFWDSVLSKYRAYWRTFTKGVTEKGNWKPAGYRAIRTGISNDFLKWENDTDLSYVDSPEEHLYENHVIPYHRAPHILLGFPTRYVERGWSESMRALPDPENRKLRADSNERYGTAITESLLMASRNGHHFHRWNEAFLRPGIERTGTWQYGQHYLAQHIVETKSSLAGAPRELSFYSTEGYWVGKGTKLRRHTLRLDGFVSVNASYKGGELLTKPIVFTGKQLELNFSTSAAGSIRVELLRPDGSSIPGLHREDCPEIFGDSVARDVTWKTENPLAKLQNQPVRLRFLLRDADLFSYRFHT